MNLNFHVFVVKFTFVFAGFKLRMLMLRSVFLALFDCSENAGREKKRKESSVFCFTSSIPHTLKKKIRSFDFFYFHTFVNFFRKTKTSGLIDNHSTRLS